MQDFIQFLNTPQIQFVIWIVVGLNLGIVGYYVVKRFRDGNAQTVHDPHQLLTNFRELHTQGGISDTEFREIKSVLGTNIKEQLSDKEEST